MMSLWGRKLAVALLALGGAAAMALAAHDGATHHEGKAREITFVFDEGDGDRLEIDDLGELAVGESRSYTTESGKTAVVTRGEDGFELELDGKTMRIGDGLEMLGGPGARHHRMRKIELDGEGDAKTFVITDDPEHDVLLFEGHPGEHGFLFDKQALPPLAMDGLIARLEKNGKFRSLDDATQQLVREAIRESAPEMAWMAMAEGEGEGAMKVIVRERRSGGEDERQEQED